MLARERETVNVNVKVKIKEMSKMKVKQRVKVKMKRPIMFCDRSCILMQQTNKQTNSDSSLPPRRSSHLHRNDADFSVLQPQEDVLSVCRGLHRANRDAKIGYLCECSSMDGETTAKS